jgi:hypothetical protein
MRNEGMIADKVTWKVGELARLQQIMSLKQLGFSLDEIKQLMEKPSAIG